MRKDITSGSGYVERLPMTEGTKEFNREEMMSDYVSGNTVAFTKGAINTLKETSAVGWGTTMNYLADQSDEGKAKEFFEKSSNTFGDVVRRMDDKKFYDSNENEIIYGIGGFLGDFVADYTNPTGLAREAMEWTTDLVGFATLGVPGVIAAQAVNAAWSSRITIPEEKWRAKQLGYESDLTWGTAFAQEVVVRTAILGAIGLGVKSYQKSQARKLGKTETPTPDAEVKDIIKNREANGMKDERTPEQVRADLEQESLDNRAKGMKLKNMNDVKEFLAQKKDGKINNKILGFLAERLRKERTPQETAQVKMAAETFVNLDAILRKEAATINTGQFGEVEIKIDRANLSEGAKKYMDENGEVDSIMKVLNKVMLDDPLTRLMVGMNDQYSVGDAFLDSVVSEVSVFNTKDIREIMIGTKGASVKIKEEVMKVKTDADLQIEAKELLGEASSIKTIFDKDVSQAKSANTTKQAKVKALIDKAKDKIATKKMVVKDEVPKKAQTEGDTIPDKVDTAMPESKDIEAPVEQKKPPVSDEEIRDDIAKEASITETKETTVEAIELSNIIKSDPSIVLKKKSAEVKKPKAKKKTPVQKYLNEVAERFDFIKRAEVERGIIKVEVSKIEERIRLGQDQLKELKSKTDKNKVHSEIAKITDKIKTGEKLISEAKAKNEHDLYGKLFNKVGKLKGELSVKNLEKKELEKPNKKLTKKYSAKIKELQTELSDKKTALSKVEAKESIVTSIKTHINDFRNANKELSKKMKSAKAKIKKASSDADIKKLEDKIASLKKEHLQNTKKMNRSEGFEYDASIQGNVEELRNIEADFNTKISEAKAELETKKEFSVGAEKAKKKLKALEKEFAASKKEMMRIDGYQMGIDTVDSHEELLNKRILINDEPVVITDVRVQWNSKEVMSANNAKQTRDGQISESWDEEKHTYIQYTKSNGETDYMYIEDLDWYDQPRLYAKEAGADFDPDFNEAYDPTNAPFMYDPSFSHEIEEGARNARVEKFAEEGYSAKEIEQMELKLSAKTWSKTDRQREAAEKTKELIGDLLPTLEELDAESLVKVTEESHSQSINANEYNNQLHSEYIFKGSRLGKKYNDFLKVYKRIQGRQFPSKTVRDYKLFKGFTQMEVLSLETRKDYTKNLSKEQKQNFLKDEAKHNTVREINSLRTSLKADLLMKRKVSNDPGELLQIDTLIKKIDNELRFEFVNAYESKILEATKKKLPIDYTSYERSLLGKLTRIKGRPAKAIEASINHYDKLIKEHSGTMFKFSNTDPSLLLSKIKELKLEELKVKAAQDLKEIKLVLQAKKDFAIKANEMYDIEELSKPASESPYVHNELNSSYNAKDERNLLNLVRTKKEGIDGSIEKRIILDKRNAKAQVTRWNKKYGTDMKLRISTEIIDDDSLKLISKILSEKDKVSGDMLRVLEQYLKREGVLEIFQELNERKVGAINGFLEHRNYYQNLTTAEAKLVREQTKSITEIIGNYDITNLIKTCN